MDGERLEFGLWNQVVLGSSPKAPLKRSVSWGTSFILSHSAFIKSGW